jgi:DNA polymerase-3 subunit alpha
MDSPELFHVNSNEQYFKTRAELYETFKTRGYCDGSIATDAEFEVMCDNTIKVAERCSNFKPDTAPKIPTNSGDVQLLKESVMRALVRRGLHSNPKKYTVDNRSVTYLEQARIELDRFIEKGFASYFIITQDFIRHGVENGWPFGPRGSVGGSLVCYLLGIHELDPLKWGLSFDRFLSPSRGGNMLNIKAE